MQTTHDMTDPTLATVDIEPWNQPPAEQRRRSLAERRSAFVQTAPILAIEQALSIRERVRRRIPIPAKDGAPAEYVYDVVATANEVVRCDGCGAWCRCASWHEWRQTPGNLHESTYAMSRDFDLCNRCSSSLRAIPLGEQWKGASAK